MKPPPSWSLIKVMEYLTATKPRYQKLEVYIITPSTRNIKRLDLSQGTISKLQLKKTSHQLSPPPFWAKSMHSPNSKSIPYAPWDLEYLPPIDFNVCPNGAYIYIYMRVTDIQPGDGLALAQGIGSTNHTFACTPSATATHAIVLLGAFASKVCFFLNFSEQKFGFFCSGQKWLPNRKKTTKKRIISFVFDKWP